MITLHHLSFSRSTRVLWLLEELGLEYELVTYQRNASFRAPETLKAVHPLGKAPIIVDGDLVLTESSAILRYLNDRYGNGTLTPPTGTAAHAHHEEWLDYVESSGALPILFVLLGGMTGGLPDGLKAFAQPEVHKVMDHISSAVSIAPFLTGEHLSLADIQMVYLLGAAKRIGALADYPHVTAYFERLMAQPGFQKAIERGGPMMR